MDQSVPPTPIVQKPFAYEPKRRYRMPVHFGPQPGPRQPVEGFVQDFSKVPVKHIARVYYLARAEQLAGMLAPGFELWGEPVLSIEFVYQRQVEWLAGRDYALCGVSVPAVCRGRTETVHGEFRLAVWESHSDVVTSGREDIGSNKLFAEIPEPRILKGRHHYHATSMGCRFFDMELHDLVEVPPTTPDHIPFANDGARNQGMMWYKYVPRTGCPGVADAEYPVLCRQPIHRPWWIGVSRARPCGFQDGDLGRPAVHVSRGELRSPGWTWWSSAARRSRNPMAAAISAVCRIID